MSDVTLKVNNETRTLDVDCVQIASLRPSGFAYFGGSFRLFAARIAFPYTRNSRNRGVLDFWNMEVDVARGVDAIRKYIRQSL